MRSGIDPSLDSCRENRALYITYRYQSMVTLIYKTYSYQSMVILIYITYSYQSMVNLRLLTTYWLWLLTKSEIIGHQNYIVN